MTDKDIIAAVTLLIALLSYVPYVVSICRGKTKPHAFSWIIWAVVTAIIFVAQWIDGGGSGAWVTGFSAACLTLIALLSLWRGEMSRTRSNWIVFGGALAAIPLWLLTKDPVWSVCLVTAIDAAAYIPTLRKSWHKPYEEMVYKSALTGVKHAGTLLALQNLSIVTVIYPLVSLIMEVILVVMLLARRWAVSRVT